MKPHKIFLVKTKDKSKFTSPNCQSFNSNEKMYTHTVYVTYIYRVCYNSLSDLEGLSKKYY